MYIELPNNEINSAEALAPFRPLVRYMINHHEKSLLKRQKKDLDSSAVVLIVTCL